MKTTPEVEFLAPNQCIIYTENGQFLQSYDSIIVKIQNGIITLDENKWDYSVTTGK